MGGLRDVGWVAVYELGEALRTRLFQLVLLAYLGGVAFATWVLTRILSEMEAQLALTLRLPPTDRPGAMLGTLLSDGRITELLRPIVGSEEAAKALLATPIAALWDGAAAMLLLPLVLLFTSAGSVSGEVRSRSIRYLAVRTSRLSIGVGKLVGQLLLGAVAAAGGVGVAWLGAMILMVGNPPWDLFVALSVRAAWAWVYALPFVGLGLAASQLLANPNGSRVLAGLVFAAMPMADWWLRVHSGTDLLGRVSDMARLFVATGGWRDFWSPDLGVTAIAGLRGAALAVLYYALGHARFATRDL